MDDTDPDWFKYINTRDLSMECGGMCILGQRYGDYYEAIIAKKVFGIRSEEDADAMAAMLGFTISTKEGFYEDFQVLTELWTAEVLKRKYGKEAQSMDIGKEQPAIVVEPAEDPFREDTPVEEPVKAPAREREEELIPA